MFNLSQNVISLNVPSKIFVLVLRTKCHPVSNYPRGFYTMVVIIQETNE